MLNPFFTQGTRGEQSLVQDLINEQLRMYGVEVYYLPRKFLTENTVIREVVQSKFDEAHPLEAYVNNYEEYEGAGTLLSKFGIEAKEEIRLTISRERYENYIAPLLKGKDNIKLSTRPKTGDLIWFPLDDRIYEIKDIERAKPYYQLQKLYVYELYCELFRYEDEVIATGVNEIDNELISDESDGLTDDGINVVQGNTQTLTVVGASSTALATATLCTSGSVRNVTITNMGSDYSVAPIVTFSAAPAGGVTATGIATITNEFIDCHGLKNGKVYDIFITNAGCGYTVAPGISLKTIDGQSGSGAAATSGINTTGSVQLVTITSGGGGYLSPPAIGISTPKHVGAAATAILGTPSIVGAGVSVISAPISIGSSAYLFPHGTTGGVYYKTAPTVTFSAPTGTGNNALATATIDDIASTGGTVNSLAITTEGKFYTSAPVVTIAHPGFSYASATINVAFGSIDPSTIAFSTTGRAYTTAPTVAISTSGTMDAPTELAVGIATIHPITGIVTAVSFDVSDPWAVGTGATIGAGYTVAPTISFSGNTAAERATATSTISIAGTVTSLSIGSSGFGYQSDPVVTIAAPAGVTTQFTATGISTIRFDSIKEEGTIGIATNIITGINTTNMIVGDRVRLGTGHSSILPEVQTFPSTTFVTAIGAGELTISETTTNVGIATTIVEVGIQNCGIVTGISITYGGGGYLSPPTVTISNDTGEKNYIEEVAGVTTATAGTLVSAANTVSTAYIADSGEQYVLTPEVVIADPPTGAGSGGSGEFEFNELITGQTSGATARVRVWDSVNVTLEIGTVAGTFVKGETIIGSTSGASHVISVVDKSMNDDGFSDNDNIELEADGILDFSETNPFGIP